MNPTLHIGFPKTATTWFRENFYPHVNDSRLIPGKIIMKELILPSQGNFNKEQFRDILKEKPSETLIICEERITGSIDVMGFSEYIQKTVAERLKSVFPSARIVLFVRNPTDAVASAYYQYVRNGGTLNINRYLEGRENFSGLNRLKHFSDSFFKYGKTIDLYRNLFGAKHTYIYIYEEFLKDNLPFLNGFISDLSLSVDLARLDLTRLNRRQGYAGTAFIRQMNRLVSPRTSRRAPLYFRNFSLGILNRILSRSDISTVKLLKRSNFDRLERYYKESNENLVKYIDAKKLEEYHYI